MSCSEVFDDTYTMGGTTDTINFFDTYCLPELKDDLIENWPSPLQANVKAMEAFKDLLLNNSAGNLLTDIGKARMAIGVCMGMSIIWSLIFIKLLSAFAE